MSEANTTARLPRVAINGFGRIGRTIMRIAKLRGHYDVVAVNDLASPEQLAYAFKYDSTHGIFPGEVSVTGDRMEINGDPFSVLSERDPAKLPWRELGVDYVIESSGVFRHIADLEKHLIAGASRVLLTVPSKDSLPLSVSESVYSVSSVASLLLSAEALGLMEHLLELTVEYCNQRRQFDKPIGKFQVIQHRLADLYIHCESIRSLLYAALANYSESSEDTKASIAALKFKVGELGRLAGEVSVQLHGAIGFTEEYSAGRYYKRLMVIDALNGNADYQLQAYLRKSMT